MWFQPPAPYAPGADPGEVPRGADPGGVRILMALAPGRVGRWDDVRGHPMQGGEKEGIAGLQWASAAAAPDRFPLEPLLLQLEASSSS